MIWAAESWFSAGPFVTLKERNTGEKYREILAERVHPITKTLFPARDGIFQDGNTVGHIQSSFDEQEDEVKHLPWPALSLDLNIIESVWSILECSIRNRYPPPASVPEFSQFLMMNGTLFL